MYFKLLKPSLSSLQVRVCSTNLIDFNAFSRVIFIETTRDFRELILGKISEISCSVKVKWILVQLEFSFKLPMNVIRPIIPVTLASRLSKIYLRLIYCYFSLGLECPFQRTTLSASITQKFILKDLKTCKNHVVIPLICTESYQRKTCVQLT